MKLKAKKNFKSHIKKNQPKKDKTSNAESFDELDSKIIQKNNMKKNINIRELNKKDELNRFDKL